MAARVAGSRVGHVAFVSVGTLLVVRTAAPAGRGRVEGDGHAQKGRVGVAFWGCVVIVRTFPPPPTSVIRSWTALVQAAAGGPGGGAELADLPRPWVPASCADPLLREAVWTWCDEVVYWLNEQYVWRPEGLIPECWPEHPHLAQELPALAFSCWSALQAATPGPFEAWQRETFPRFGERMASRLGAGGCSHGKHEYPPTHSRLFAYNSSESVARRRAVIVEDMRDGGPDAGGRL